MSTFFVHTELPLADDVKAVFAAAHAAGTGGNQLAIINNKDDTECLVKIHSALNPTEIIPVGFVPIGVIETVDEARALLATDAWIKPFPVA